MKTSTFYDFCQKTRWKFRFIWRLQSLIFKDVHYYFDKEQNVYCRRIDNIKGEEVDGYFVPKHNLLVNYKQKI